MTTNPGQTAATSPAIIAKAHNLVKTYGKGSTSVHALAGVSVEFPTGEFTAIMGPSGSGKSTLMHCMAGLDKATSGSVTVAGKNVSAMKEKDLTKLRRNELGFIFQSFNLVPTLNASENITLPLDIAKRKVDRDFFNQVITAVGLQDRLTHRPSELSGGQQQRVACARALVSKPAVIFADEPTGNLDSTSSGEVLGFLKRSVKEFGQTVVMVTHDPVAASYADRVLFLADGNIVEELRNPDSDSVLETLRTLSRRPKATPEVSKGDADV